MGYIQVGDPETRVRNKGGKCTLTSKAGSGIQRGEKEETISDGVFEILWPLTKDKRLTKTRHNIIGSDGLTWEIDVYKGSLEGLVTAEVELPSAEAQAVMPEEIRAVLIQEVTDDQAFKNQYLAVNGIPSATKGG